MTEMNNTQILYIKYWPNTQYYNFRRPGIHHVFGMLDIFRKSPFMLPNLDAIDRLTEDDSYQVHKKLTEILVSSYAHLKKGFPLTNSEAEYRTEFKFREDISKFLEKPENEQQEPKKFLFCQEYVRFEEEKRKQFDDPKLKDAKNFAYLLDSIEGEEMQLKTFNSLRMDVENAASLDTVEKGFNSLSIEEAEDATAEEKSMLEMMPDNILVDICSNLDVASLAAMKTTCKKLEEVASDYEVWRNIIAHKFNITKSVLKREPDNGSWEQVYKTLHQQQKQEARCCRKRQEQHWFIVYIPNIMTTPNPAAYKSLTKFLKKARTTTEKRYEQWVNNELRDYEMIDYNLNSKPLQFELTREANFQPRT